MRAPPIFQLPIMASI
jgi:hypothetical protein